MPQNRQGFGYGAVISATPPAVPSTSRVPSSPVAVAGGGTLPAPHQVPSPAAYSAISVLSASSFCHMDQLCCYSALVELEEQRHSVPSKISHPSDSQATTRFFDSPDSTRLPPCSSSPASTQLPTCSGPFVSQATTRIPVPPDSPATTPLASTSNPDLWLDANCLHALQFGQSLDDAPMKERKRFKAATELPLPH